MDWYTSDPHHGHEGILEVSGNNIFKNTAVRTREIIRRFNSVVDPGGTVYFIGDVTMKSPDHKYWLEKIIAQYKCKRKILILGNHDRFDPFTYIDIGFESVHTSLVLESLNIALVHDPVVSIVDPSKLWICGHAHDLFKIHKNVINVSVEANNYYPMSQTEVETIRKDMVKNGFLPKSYQVTKTITYYEDENPPEEV